MQQKGPGTSNQSLFRLQNKFRKIPSLVMYYLTKFGGIIKSGFCVNTKIKSVNLCEPIHDINYSTFMFFSIWKVWKGRGKLQKLE